MHEHRFNSAKALRISEMTFWTFLSNVSAEDWLATWLLQFDILVEASLCNPVWEISI